MYFLDVSRLATQSPDLPNTQQKELLSVSQDWDEVKLPQVLFLFLCCSRFWRHSYPGSWRPWFGRRGEYTTDIICVTLLVVYQRRWEVLYLIETYIRQDRLAVSIGLRISTILLKSTSSKRVQDSSHVSRLIKQSLHSCPVIGSLVVVKDASKRTHRASPEAIWTSTWLLRKETEEGSKTS